MLLKFLWFRSRTISKSSVYTSLLFLLHPAWWFNLALVRFENANIDRVEEGKWEREWTIPIVDLVSDSEDESKAKTMLDFEISLQIQISSAYCLHTWKKAIFTTNGWPVPRIRVLEDTVLNLFERLNLRQFFDIKRYRAIALELLIISKNVSDKSFSVWEGRHTVPPYLLSVEALKLCQGQLHCFKWNHVFFSNDIITDFKTNSAT